jgi:uncharacterized repeat protein (TIGR03803 family)
MRGKRLSIRLTAALAMFAATLLLVASTFAAAQLQEEVLHSFQNDGTDGIDPGPGLISDGAGNLYGTTSVGGTHNWGTVFELSPAAGGGWTEKVLYSFASVPDGSWPMSALIFDAAGNLYGTTLSGGTNNGGTVFELSPDGGGGWTEKVLHNFGIGGIDGDEPQAGLIFDAAGNLYGTTGRGGGTFYGTVFELSPDGGGGWTEQVLHSFGAGTDGAFPYAGLIFDAAGNLYGTTYEGGAFDTCAAEGCGTVFELMPAAGGNWTEKVLYSFDYNSGGGIAPSANLIFDGAGNLYGTTSSGYYGDSNGTVFELSPTAGGNWTEQVLHSFGSGTDGNNPVGSLIFDFAGNLYGTTAWGGTFSSCLNGCGTVFELMPAAGGNWTEQVLHNFADVPDGSWPHSALIFDTAGNLYGTTLLGGNSAHGTVFEIAIPSTALQFVPLSQPCRAVDTRPSQGGMGPIQGGTSQNFAISGEGACAVLPNAAVYSMNVTVVPSNGTLGYLTAWPTGQTRPVASTLNSVDGRVKANAAIVPGGNGGQVSIYVTDTTDVIVDVNGYFAPPTGSTLAFYPLAPCRVADTRNGTFPPGLGPPSLTGGQPRDFPILNATTTCNIPASGAAAYSLNFTVVPSGTLGYLTVWPTGETQPTVSTLNDVLGRVIANAAIVVAGTGSEVSVYPTNDTDLIIDINGYFAAAGQGGLSLYGVQPCRVIDTRHIGTGQPFSGTLSPPVDVVNSPCGVPATAQAYVFNATVIPTGALGYLTLWPDGADQPLVSTLNAADGSLSNNMAIVPAGTQGKIDAYAGNGLTQLILDISSYFAP